MQKVARNTRSSQNDGEQLVESPRERLRSEVQSLTLKYTIFDKRYPFRVSSIEKLYPFHISAL